MEVKEGPPETEEVLFILLLPPVLKDGCCG